MGQVREVFHPPPTPSAVLVLTLQEIEEHTGGTQLSTVSLRRNPQSITSHHKTLSYLDNVMAHREAHQKGAMEALMLNTKGNLTCAAAANLFWSHGRKLYTPALEEGALPGITRSFVLQTAPGAGFDVKEGAWPPSVLLAAECVFLTNSLIGLREVESLDGVQLSCNLSVVEALRKTGFSL